MLNLKHNAMKNFVLSFFCFLFLTGIQAQTYTLDSTVLTSRVVIDSIDIPWEITWGPDDHIWMTERFGRVSRLNPTTGVQTEILNLSGTIYQQSESGLLGMALHPDFLNQPYVYLVYTYRSGTVKEKMVRYFYNGTTLVNPTTFIDNITGNTTHDGSRLYFLPDSTLLMTTGDAQSQPLSQNINSLNGKVLRFNLDGTVPSDNPIPSSYVYSWGHRNAQGLAIGPNNIIYCSEHGPTTDDELQIIHKARNYGWPSVAGFCNTTGEINFCADSNVVTPLVAWTPTIAPSDILWYNHPSIPEFDNKLLMTVLKDKKLIAFDFNAAGDTVLRQTHYLTGQLNRLRDICVSPEGKIYLATNGSSWSNSAPFTHTIVELYNAAYIPSTIISTEKAEVKIWPNPIGSGQNLNLKLPSGQSANITIYDLQGKEVLRTNMVSEGNLQLSLPAAVYVYRISLNNGKTESGKLIVR
jgi:glucose/arabinose dehydrogenase